MTSDQIVDKTWQFNSFVYLSSKSDEAAVNAITKNWKQFLPLATEHGFRLSVEDDSSGNVIIRLTQSSTETRLRQVLVELDNLVKMCLMHDNCREIEVPKPLKPWSEMTVHQKLDLVLNQQVKAGLIISEQERELSFLREKVDKSTIVSTGGEMKMKFDDDCFFKQVNLQAIKDSPRVLDRICDAMADKERCFSHPIVGSPKAKRTGLLEFLDFLSFGKQGKEFSKMQEEIMKCFDQWNEFNFPPDETEKDRISSEMKEKYGVEGVIGTVHLVGPYMFRGIEEFYMILGVVEKKIVTWTTHSLINKNNDGPLDVLHEHIMEEDDEDLNDSPFFASKYKLATNLPIPDNYSNVLLHTENTEMFQENAKVATFFMNNFQHLKQYWTPHLLFCIDNVYNVLYELF